VKKWGCPITNITKIAKPASASPVLSAEPSGWVGRFAGLMPAGLVLDLACGSGRHVPLIIGLGHPVLAVDRDLAALAIIQAAGHAALQTLQFDLESEQAAQHPDWPFAPARFAGIVVTNYLHRPLFDAMLASLAPGGVLIAETFADGNGLFGKPSNPAFLLQPGELLTLAQRASDLRVLAFEDGYVAAPKPAMVQRICLRKADGQARYLQLQLN
jgi:SAM-dependent methyltransferase